MLPVVALLIALGLFLWLGAPMLLDLIGLDITPPTAATVDRTVYYGKEVVPEEFVTDIQDENPVTVRFKEPPPTEVGTHTVRLVLEDTFQNTTELTATLTILQDTTPPEIQAPLVQYATKGGAFAYKKELTVTDNSEAEVDVQVDSSAVDLNREGSYPVHYTATDKSGNVSKLSVTVIVREDVDDSKVKPLAQQVIDSIIQDGMTAREKCRAIYTWVRKHVSYVDHGDKINVISGAYQGLTTGRGDCYTFYAVAEYLLNLAGVENVGVQRVPGTRYTHYWHIVKVEDGWYYFDTTPHKQGGDTCLFTESQAQAFTRARGDKYYEYDKSLTPGITVVP